MSPLLAVDITQQIDIAAPPEKVFANLLAQLGENGERPDGTAMPMRLEAHPGGRWFRDMGSSGGHLWAHVQVIKPPALLELSGPLFMSYPAVNFLQYRLVEIAGGTRLTLKHQAMGPISDEHREGVTAGWMHLLQCVQRRSE